ncbi:MAG: heavy metal-responsive transcriptional regulator [Pirellulaceae bacterium]|nr:heavy metal-responsive transcriptional regulator [Fuerstiella sp.]
MKPLTIGKVAERAGVGIETIRFYEREGLLEEPTRSASGYRQFDEDVVKRLMFIGRAKELGFTLKEIKELLSLRVDPETCCEDVKAKADAKIADIENKIVTLRKMKKALARLTKACGEREPTDECPILQTLDGRRTTARQRMQNL